MGVLKHFNIKNMVFYIVTLTMFLFPISNSLKSICLVLSVLAILADAEIRASFNELINKPWFIATLLLLLVLVLGLFYGDANWQVKLTYFNKYSKILYLPLLALAFRDKRTRDASINAFLLAMVTTFIVSLIQKMGWINLGGGPFDDDKVFLNRIDTGIFMAFGAYISALKALKASKGFKITYGLLALILSFYVIVLNSSRTGFFVLFVLLLVFVIQQAALIKKYFPYLIVLATFFLVLASQSASFKQGLGLIAQDVKRFQSGEKHTSLGFRVQFSQYSKKLFAEKPLMGYGSGGFSYQYGIDTPVQYWGPKLGDPHNQYWSFAVDYGLIGFLAMLYFFFSIAYACRKIKENRLLAFGLFSFYLLANFCDSFLLLANGGYLFIIFSALLLGESLAIKEKEPVYGRAPMAEVPC